MFLKFLFQCAIAWVNVQHCFLFVWTHFMQSHTWENLKCEWVHRRQKSSWWFDGGLDLFFYSRLYLNQVTTEATDIAAIQKLQRGEWCIQIFHVFLKIFFCICEAGCRCEVEDKNPYTDFNTDHILFFNTIQITDVNVTEGCPNMKPKNNYAYKYIL